MKVSEIQALLRAARKSVDGVEGVAKDAFDAFDSAIDKLETYAGVDISRAAEAIAQAGDAPQLAKQLSSLTAERDGLASQLEASTTLALKTSRDLAAVRSLGAAGIRPDYEELLLPKVAAQMKTADDGTVTLPDGLMTELKTKYASMFHADDAAGTGGTVAGGTTATPGPKQVSVGSDRLISGIDPLAVLSGEVSLVESDR